MTYVFEKTFGKFDSSTNFEGNKLIVEYCFSSVDECIKIVEMTRIGANEFGEIGENFHRFTWMSEEGQASLMEDLENDFTNRICGTNAEESYMDNLLTTGFDTEIDLDRDVPGFEGTMEALEDLVDGVVGEPEFLGVK